MNQLIKINKLELWYETFGNKNNPAILLIMGAGAQGIFWPDEFCQKLTNNGFYVIRYDHRDTGLSTCFDFAKNPYDLKTLAKDALNLLDKLTISKTHIIGTSMGGYVAQLLAVYHPENVLSLTLIASTTDLSVLADIVNKRDLSVSSMEPSFPEVIAMLQDNSPAPQSTDEARARLVSSWRILNGKEADFDEDFYNNLALKALERTKNSEAAGNHLKAIDRTVFNIKPALANLKIPTLVIHGSADPILPLSHGKSIADAIPDAEFIVIKKLGHMLSQEFLIGIITKLPI
jgi:pimeloyl-ACP methyl ester carboxylesterase